MSPEPTLTELLSKVDSLLTQARTARKTWDDQVLGLERARIHSGGEAPVAIQPGSRAALDDAETKLSSALHDLRTELRMREEGRGAAGANMPASEDRRQLAVRLADCYGSLGGIARRKGDFRHAVEMYGKGTDLEQSSPYGIAASYNRVQSIVARILLDPASIMDPDGQLGRHASQLLDEILGDPSRDPWASADAYLLALIVGRRRIERDEWRKLDKSGAIDDVFKSGLLVLIELSRALPRHDRLREAIANYDSKLPPPVG